MYFTSQGEIQKKKKKEVGVKRKNEIKISRYTGKVFTLLFVQKKNIKKFYYLFIFGFC
jgi:hypothetical protein